MTRHAFWRYELVSRHDQRVKRQGALLRFTLDGGDVGYADCHPWPELGDDPLDDQLRTWSEGRWTPILDQSTLLAFIDAEARSEGRSLFAGLAVPASHLSLPNAAGLSSEERSSALHRAGGEGFDRVKVKAGDDPSFDVEWLAELGGLCQAFGFKARIDLNTKLDFEAVTVLVDRLRVRSGGLHWIDWVEDPCALEPHHWAALRKSFGVRLASDRVSKLSRMGLGRSADVIVYKSAVCATLPYAHLARTTNLSVCYTSYLDHPVGQAFAAYSAAANVIEATTVETCGLLTHDVYEPNGFSERIGSNGPVLIPPEGTGIGFDDLLENLPWQELN